MSYVESNLLAGERIVHSAKMHWFIYVPGGVLVVLAIFFFAMGSESGSMVLGAFMFPFGLFLLIKA